MISRLLSARNLFAAYLITVVLLMILPLNSGAFNNIFVLQLRGDYLLHTLLFLPWAFFGYFLKKSMLLWLFAGIIFAVSSEGIQYILPYRAFNVNDVMANVIGVMAGYALLWLIRIIIKLTNAHNH